MAKGGGKGKARVRDSSTDADAAPQLRNRANKSQAKPQAPLHTDSEDDQRPSKPSARANRTRTISGPPETPASVGLRVTIMAGLVLLGIAAIALLDRAGNSAETHALARRSALGGLDDDTLELLAGAPLLADPATPRAVARANDRAREHLMEHIEDMSVHTYGGPSRRAVIPGAADPYSTQKIAPWYSCDASTCQLPKCQCAQTRPPVGLQPQDVPQFVTVTVDDAVNEIVWKEPRTLVDGIRSPGPGACPARVTYFVSAEWTDWHRVQELAMAGHEIASHTFAHTAFPAADEMEAMRQTAEAFAGISSKNITGFRAPSLRYSLQSLAQLRALGYHYDSSMSLVPNGNQTIWPFTFDNGLPINCATGNCTGATPPPADSLNKWRAPGLWEIPMYTMKDPAIADVNWAIDAPFNASTVKNMLEAAFDDHYFGNRAPFGIHVHGAWLIADSGRAAALHDFLVKISTSPKYNATRLVTNSQMLTWLRNPKTLTQMDLAADPSKCSSVVPASVLTGTEVCDGYDNNGNGQVDEGLTRQCNYGSYLFDTCAACPRRKPTLLEPVPPLSTTSTVAGGTSCAALALGCGYGTFDKASCKCVCHAPSEDVPACDPDAATGRCLIWRVPNVDQWGTYLSCADSKKWIDAEHDRLVQQELAKQQPTANAPLTTATNNNAVNKKSSSPPALAIIPGMLLALGVLIGTLLI